MRNQTTGREWIKDLARDICAFAAIIGFIAALSVWCIAQTARQIPV